MSYKFLFLFLLSSKFLVLCTSRVLHALKLLSLISEQNIITRGTHFGSAHELFLALNEDCSKQCSENHVVLRIESSVFQHAKDMH